MVDRILSRLEAFGIKLGLDSTRRVLHRLGDPQAGLPLVLVAGTNGKGSTAALIAAIATAAGYRTGLYTSPHVERVEERIRLDGAAIGTDRLGEILVRVVRGAEESVGHPPTYFEALTEAAFLFFAEEGVELAVMEAGLGGRLDATNVGDPMLSVITEVGFDHMQQLGGTLESIAREKAGILRNGRPALAWTGSDEVRRALIDSAIAIGARLEMVSDRQPIGEVEARGHQGQRVTVLGHLQRYELDLRLSGRHQLRNLALAVRSAEVLSELGLPRIDAATIARGVADCRWPGRLELVETAEGYRVLLDAAHNPMAIGVLLEFLDTVEPEFDLLFGVLEDKQVEQMLPQLASRAGELTLTRPDSQRAVSPESLASMVGGRASGFRIVVPASRALDQALREDGRLLVVCGSIYLVGAARHHLRRRFGVPGSISSWG